jgi:hypothetical protein
MKHTKLAGFVVGFVFLFTIFVKESEALVPLPRTLVTIVPSPTPLIIRKIIDQNIFKVISTNTPVPTIASVVSPTTLPTDKPLSSTTPKQTESDLATPTLTETPTPEVTIAVAEPSQTDNTSTKSQDNLTFWFLVVTVGLLAVIIVIQAWPKKNEEE